MAIIVNSIITSLTEDRQEAIRKAVGILEVPEPLVQSAYIAKTSLDARRRGDIRFVHSVSVTLADGEARVAERAQAKGKKVVLRVEEPLEAAFGPGKLSHRPVIAGFGPAGMFAGLLLAKNGYAPLILERGGDMDSRVASVERFWSGGSLDPETNVQFGEGGAGTFSDGKLTTRIGDPKCAWVLREFVRFGAPEEILHRAKPHIGTDRLRSVVKRLRAEIESLGGEVRFYMPASDLILENGRLCAVRTTQGDVPADVLILAAGHSARDTFEMLLRRGLVLQPKPFSVGVRVEHLQSEIDRGLYGKYAGHPALPVGEYQLSYRTGEGRGVYTFCMCPGGVVVPAASQEGMVVTNGMSDFARDGTNANAALAVSVTPDDFGTAPLDGMRFQQELERRAFTAGGRGYGAPAQDAKSFLEGKTGLHSGRVEPTYARGVCGCDFGALFPGFVTEMLKTGLRTFGRKLPGFDAADTLLTGVETRTSSPVRIPRGMDFYAPNAAGVIPCGEGAGYAGGIMSAAVDGLRAALALMAVYGRPAPR